MKIEKEKSQTNATVLALQPTFLPENQSNFSSNEQNSVSQRLPWI